MNNDIVMVAIKAEIPDIIPNQEFYVYVPKASTTNPGIAAFNGDDFNIINGVVTIDTEKWGDKDFVEGFKPVSANRIVRDSTNYTVTIDDTLKTLNITSTDSETLDNADVLSLPTTYNIPIKAGRGTTFVLSDNIVAVQSDVGVKGATIGAEIFNAYDGTNVAIGNYSHVEGKNNVAAGDYAHVEGYNNRALVTGAHVEGTGNYGDGNYSHAEGYGNTANGADSHAEGVSNTSGGTGSHAEGNGNAASGDASHAEGGATLAADTYSHAEGYDVEAHGTAAHAEGYGTNANGIGAHAEGYNTIAGNNSSLRGAHAEGLATEAYGDGSHAEGSHTIANGIQHVSGAYNVPLLGPLELVGNGEDADHRHNARVLYADGNHWIAGKYIQEGTPSSDKDLTTKLYVDSEINRLETIIGTGEDYIGQMSGSSLPTTAQLNAFVQEEAERDPKGGDTIMFLLYVTGDEDKIYKYMYNGTEWSSFLLPAVEVSNNGELGVVKGTYGVESTNDILVDIADGEIKHLYGKDGDGEYATIGLPASVSKSITSIYSDSQGFGLATTVTETRGDNTDISYVQTDELPLSAGSGIALDVVNYTKLQISAEVNKSYVDAQDAVINNRITDSNIRINNLERSVYGELSDWSDETFLVLKNAILPSTITVDDSTYNVIDGARGILSSAKGNTKKFNQLVQNGNFESKSGWAVGNLNSDNWSTSNNELSVTYVSSINAFVYKQITQVKGHKYLFLIKSKKSTAEETCQVCLFPDIQSGVGSVLIDVTSTEYSLYSRIYTASTIKMHVVAARSNYIGCVQHSKDCMLIDLTAMGLGSITTVDEFTALYPKAYYEYDAGTLYDSVISGLALTGKNLFDEESVLPAQGFVLQQDGSYYIAYASNVNGDKIYTNSTGYNGRIAISLYKKEATEDTRKSLMVKAYYTDGTTSQTNWDYSSSFIRRTFVTAANKTVDYIAWSYHNGVPCWIKDIQIEIGSSATPYEPYHLHTISLPSAQTLGGVGTEQDEIQVTKNANDDCYTIKKYVRKQQSALSEIPQWNSLARQITESPNYWGFSNGSRTISDNIISLTSTARFGQVYMYSSYFSVISGHKYYVREDLRASVDNYANAGARFISTNYYLTLSTAWTTLSFIETASSSESGVDALQVIRDANSSDWATIECKNIVILDLTAIFGVGNEPSTVNELPYWIRSATYFDYKAIGSGVDTSVTHNYLYSNDNDVAWTSSVATETTLTETAALAEVSAIRENGGMISVVGNDNEDYAQPDVSETILHSVTPNA